MIKKQQYQAAAVVVILAIVVFFVFKNPAKKAEAPTETQNQTTDNQTSSSTQKTSEQKMDQGSWQGTLKTSDNSKKGNLMLVMKDHTIYLRTSRDYSPLIGKQVVVTYKGALDSFGLTDITAK